MKKLASEFPHTTENVALAVSDCVLFSRRFTLEQTL